MVWMMTLAAWAGPMPMFGRAPTPPPAVAASTAPASGVVVVPFVVAPSSVFEPPTEAEPKPRHAFPARLPFVEAEPVKTRVRNPGRLTPIDQIPSAFAPIPSATTQPPAARLTPVIVIEPPSAP